MCETRRAQRGPGGARDALPRAAGHAPPHSALGTKSANPNLGRHRGRASGQAHALDLQGTQRVPPKLHSRSASAPSCKRNLKCAQIQCNFCNWSALRAKMRTECVQLCNPELQSCRVAPQLRRDRRSGDGGRERIPCRLASTNVRNVVLRYEDRHDDNPPRAHSVLTYTPCLRAGPYTGGPNPPQEDPPQQQPAPGGPGGRGVGTTNRL